MTIVSVNYDIPNTRTVGLLVRNRSGMQPSSSAPDQGSLATVVIDTKTGTLYFQN